jgi:hypothetical protein
MDVVARAPASTTRFNGMGVHPTPVLRVPINLILLRRLGFTRTAEDLSRVWRRLYPRISADDIPPAFMKVFYPAAELAVDTMAFQPYRQFGDKSLSRVLEFGPKHMAMVEYAGQRLAEGHLGTVPLRFMIGAARFALDRRLATPQTITDNFYRILGRR